MLLKLKFWTEVGGKGGRSLYACPRRSPPHRWERLGNSSGTPNPNFDVARPTFFLNLLSDRNMRLLFYSVQSTYDQQRGLFLSDTG